MRSSNKVFYHPPLGISPILQGIYEISQIRVKMYSRYHLNVLITWGWNAKFSTNLHWVVYPYYGVFMKFQEKIKQARKKKDWSQMETAKKLNMSLNAYGCLERGESRPTLRRLEQLAQVFETNLVGLVSDDERNFFNLGGTYSNHCQNWYSNSPSEQLSQLQHELEKVHLITQQQATEIEYLKQQNADLRELVNVLKKTV